MTEVSNSTMQSLMCICFKSRHPHAYLAGLGSASTWPLQLYQRYAGSNQSVYAPRCALVCHACALTRGGRGWYNTADHALVRGVCRRRSCRYPERMSTSSADLAWHSHRHSRQNGQRSDSNTGNVCPGNRKPVHAEVCGCNKAHSGRRTTSACCSWTPPRYVAYLMDGATGTGRRQPCPGEAQPR